MQLFGIHAETAEQVTTMHAVLAVPTDRTRIGRLVRRLKLQRPVWTMPVVVRDVDPQDLLQMRAPNDQEPVQTLGAHRAHPAFGVGVRLGRLHRRQHDISALRAEHVVEAAAELRVPIAQQKAHLTPSLLQPGQQVAGLLGGPGASWVGGHAGQVAPPGADLDEEQHIQPPQPDGVNGEEVAGNDPGGLLA
jgi:hypothetical protein